MTRERPVQIIHSRAADALIQRQVLHLQRRSLHQLLHQRLRDHGADSAGGVPGGRGRVIQVVCVDLLELLAVNQVPPIRHGHTIASTEQGRETRNIGPDSSRFPVSISIHAVGHVVKRDASHEGVVPRGDRHSARHAVLVHNKAAGDACDVAPGYLRDEALQGQAEDFIVLAVGGVRGEGDGVAVGGIRPPPLAAVQEDGLAFHELKHGPYY